MRHAHLFAPLGLAAWLAASPPISAQAMNGPGSAPPTAAAPLQILDPAAESLPLHHTPLPSGGAVAQDWADWREANAAVAEFPRGHMDILRWEAARAGQAPPPANGHGMHGSQP